MDATRILALIAIVAGHSFPNDALLGRATFSWHVPVFFFIAGLLWRSGRTLHEEVVRRSRSLLLPYGAWFVVLFIAYEASTLVLGRLDLRTAAQLLWGGYYTRAPFTTFWFLTVLFFTALLYRALEEVGLWAKILGTVLGLVLTVGWGDVLARSPLGAGSALTCVVFVAAGEFAGAFFAKRRVSSAFAAIAGAIGLLLAIAGVTAPLNLKAGFFGTPIASPLAACAISFGLLAVCDIGARRAGDRGREMLSRLAMPAVAVVLLHPVVLYAIDVSGLLPSQHFAAFVGALVGPWLLGILLHSTRLSPLLLGLPQRRPQRRNSTGV